MRWHRPYLGLSEFPADLSTFELDYFFTFSAKEIAALKSRYKPLLRIGAAIQLGFLKMTGCAVSAFKVVPRKLLNHVGQQLGDSAPTIASLRSLYKKRKRTLYEHQAWAIEHLHLSEMGERQERMLYARMREIARTSASLDILIQYAREWMYERKLLIPSDRKLRDKARRAMVAVEKELYEAVVAAIPKDVRERWLKVLTTDPPRGGRATVLWLDQGSKRGIKKGLGEQFIKRDFLCEIGVADYPIEAISIEKQRFYARRLRRRRPARLAELREPRRTLEIVCFLRMALQRTTDDVLHMTRQRAADLMREARDETVRQDARSAISYREAVLAIQAVIEDPKIDAEAARAQVRTVLTKLQPKVGKTRAAATRDRLLENTQAVRSLLRSVTALPIEGAATEPVREAIDTLRDIYANNITTLDPSIKPKVKSIWRDQVSGPDRERALRAFEVSTLMDLRQALRRGTAWAKDSLDFRDRETVLIPQPAWQKDRLRYYERVKLPQQAKRFYKPILAQLEAGLEAVAECVRAGSLVIENDDIHLPPIKPETLPKELAKTRDALFREIGEVQLPELLLEMDCQLHFSRELLGRPANSERELLTLYGACLALGTELDATGVALMTPKLDASQILAAMRGLEDERGFRHANEAAVAFIRRHPIAKYWGEGKTASADMMSLETSRRLWRARMDPRRGVPAVGVYQHVSDQWAIVHDMPIVLMDRQAGAAIEGVVRQTEVEIERLAVDTHGYTDFGMGVSKGLGFDLCPRLKNLRERRLCVPPGVRVPAILEAVVDRDISLRAIDTGWDGFVRVVASIEEGTSAVLVLERFGSATKGDITHNAGSNIGRMLRTTFLCDYFSNPVFRRELHRILNYGESLHWLERAIYTGRMAPWRGRRMEELVAISGALTLLTNLVMAWTTWRAQAVIDGWKSLEPRLLTENELAALMAHIAPSHFGNINFRGILQYPIERFRDRLLSHVSRRGLTVVGAAG
jgi:TnpA family transposase